MTAPVQEADGRSRWQNPETGWPTTDYITAVDKALDERGVTVHAWWGDEDWDITYAISDDIAARMGFKALFIGWNVGEESSPLTGDWLYRGEVCGWNWAPRSRPAERGADFVEPIDVPMFADPAHVADAVKGIVLGAEVEQLRTGLAGLQGRHTEMLVHAHAHAHAWETKAEMCSRYPQGELAVYADAAFTTERVLRGEGEEPAEPFDVRMARAIVAHRHPPHLWPDGPPNEGEFSAAHDEAIAIIRAFTGL
ncbi:hypothetical protein ACFHW2_11565 [Actinomadura sp. LOL_016]|uniref:hypothetical protein n=1 Tax=unclassified Actinomadura TaxID=2626254 RepID=UPI003A7FCADB